MLTGHVTAFDPEGGWGRVATERGETFAFHATSIASGLRTIEVGAAVAFVRVPGRSGKWEADDVTAIRTGEAERSAG
jgi:cold shock CspA family protein